MSLANRRGGVGAQDAIIKFIAQIVAPATDANAVQIYDLPTTDDNVSTGLLLKDRDGIQHPVVVGADGCGVVQIEFGDSPFQVLPHHRKVLVDTSGGAVTCILPAGAAIQPGTGIEFVDQARSFGTNNLTIDGGAANINGAGTLVRSADDAGVTLTWGGVTWEFPTAAAMGAGDMLLGTAQTVTESKTFADTKLLLRNAANTFSTTLKAAGATAARVLSLPDATDTLATLGLAQLWTGIQTIGHQLLKINNAGATFATRLGSLATAARDVNFPDLAGNVVVAPAVPTAFTQTYATADATIAALTAAALTEGGGVIGGTNDGDLPALVDPAGDAGASVIAGIRENAAMINKLVADILAMKKNDNSIIDAAQAGGLAT